MKRFYIPIISFFLLIFSIGFIYNAYSSTYISDAQKSIIRDTKRLNDLTLLRSAIENYKAKNGYYPKLETGTNIKGYVASTWGAQWNSFCNLIGLSSCPTDPVNEILNCDCSTFGVCTGDNVNSNIDVVSCYNNKNQSFACTVGSNIYQYQSLNNGRNYSLMMEFEYSDNVNWDVTSSAPDNYVAIKDTCRLGSNLSAKILSNKPPKCGDGILSYSEVCEIGSKKTEFCNDSNGKLGKRVVNCTSNCTWDNTSTGSCVVGKFCGDGLIDAGEDCDGGYQKMCFNFNSDSKHSWYNEQLRYCTINCRWDKELIDSTAYCGGYCGDGTVQSSNGEECDSGSKFSSKWSSTLSKFLFCEDRKTNTTSSLDDSECSDDSNCSWVNNSCVNINPKNTMNDKHCNMSSCKYENFSPVFDFDFYNNRLSSKSYIKSNVWSGDKLQYTNDYYGTGNVDLIIADKQGDKYVAVWNSDFVEIKVNATDRNNDILKYKYSIVDAYNSNIQLKYNNGSNWVDYSSSDFITSNIIRVYPKNVSGGNNLKNTLDLSKPYQGNLLFGSNFSGPYSINVVVTDDYSLGAQSTNNPHKPTSSYTVNFDIGSGCGDRILDKTIGESCEFKPNESVKNIYMNWGVYTNSTNNTNYQQPDGSGDCVAYKFIENSFNWGGKLDDVSCSGNYYGLCERRSSFGCSGWISGPSDNCYLITKNSGNYDSVKSECQSYNAQLVIVDDAIEEKFINSSKDINPLVGSKNIFWTGYKKDSGYFYSIRGGRWSDASSLNNYDIYRDKIYNSTTGISALSQYSCGLPWENGACRQVKGYCGDGLYSSTFEECDKTDKSSYGKGTDIINQYGCGVGDGVSDNNPNNNLCRDQDGWCGDFSFNPIYEHCDPTVRLTPSESGSTNYGITSGPRQYVCQPKTKNNEVVYFDFADYEKSKNLNSNIMCRKSFGGYCGDGQIQMFYSKDSNGNYIITSSNIDSQTDTDWTSIYFDVSSKKYKYNGLDMNSDELNSLIEECDPTNYPCDPDSKEGSCILPKNSDSIKQYGGCGKISESIAKSPVVLSCYVFKDASGKIVDCAGSCTVSGSYPNKVCNKKNNDNNVCTINYQENGPSYTMVNYTGECGCRKIYGGYCGDRMVQTQFDEECDPNQTDSSGFSIYSNGKLTKANKDTISQYSNVDSQYLCGQTISYSENIADLKKRDSSGAIVNNSFTAKYSNLNNNEIACNTLGGYCGDGFIQSDYTVFKNQSDQSWMYSNQGSLEQCDPKNLNTAAKYSSIKNTYSCGSVLTNKACRDLYFNEKNSANKYGGYCGDSYVQYNLTSQGIQNNPSNYSVFRSTVDGSPEECDYLGHNVIPKESNSNNQYACGLTPNNDACADISGYCGDGSVNIYKNWASYSGSSEPNGGVAENCVVINGKNDSNTGKWIDADCSWNLNYVCEQENPLNNTCPGGFVKFSAGNYNCYSVSSIKTNFNSINCPVGSHIAIINTKEENDFVSNLVESINDWAWIGFNDLDREGEFVWAGNDGYIEECDPNSVDYKTGNTSRILVGEASASSVNKQYLCGSTGTWSNIPSDVKKYNLNGGVVSGFAFDNKNQSNNSCITFGGFCGDSVVQHDLYTTKNQTDQTFFYSNPSGTLEQCDPTNHSVMTRNSSSTNQYYCGNPNQPDACMDKGGYCGDGVRQTREDCDPSSGDDNDYSSTILVANKASSITENSSYEKQYRCGKPQKFTTIPGIKDKYSINGSVIATFADADLSSENNTSACTTFGGYCGDGVIQVTSDLEKTQSDQSWFYSNKGILEECDPKNHSVVAQYSSVSNSYICGSVKTDKACYNLSFAEKDLLNRYGGYCGDGYVQYNLTSIPLQNNSVNYSTFQNTALGDPEECDPSGHTVSSFYSSANNTYICGSIGTANSCRDLLFTDNNKSGYCGDGKIQYDLNQIASNQGDSAPKGPITVSNSNPEQCDPNGHSVLAKDSSANNTYYCGSITDGSSYSCRDIAYSNTNTITKKGGYCGDGTVQDGTNGTLSKEECDPLSTDYSNGSLVGGRLNSSSVKQYLCASTAKWTNDPADTSRYKNDGSNDSTFVYNNVNNSDNSCRTFGGYCGDGVIQYSLNIKKTQSDQSWFYSAPSIADNIEECDPKNHSVVAQYSSNTNTYTCGSVSTSNSCLNLDYNQKDSLNNFGGYCGDGYVQYDLISQGLQNDPANYLTFQTKSSGNPEQCDPNNHIVSSFYSSPNNTYSCGSNGTPSACRDLDYSQKDSNNKYGGYCGDGKIQYDLNQIASNQGDSAPKGPITVSNSNPEQCDPNSHSVLAKDSSANNTYYCGSITDGSSYSCRDIAYSNTNAITKKGGYCGDGTVQDGTDGTQDKEDCDYLSYIPPTPQTSSSTKTYVCGDKITNYPNDPNHDLACRYVDANHGGGYCGDASVQFCKGSDGLIKTNHSDCWDSNNIALNGVTSLEQCDPDNHNVSPNTSSRVNRYVCGLAGAADSCMDKGGYCGDGTINMSLNLDAQNRRISTTDYVSTNYNYNTSASLEKCDPSYTPTITETNNIFANGNKLPNIYVHSAGNSDTSGLSDNVIKVNNVVKNTITRSWAVHVFDANFNYLESKNYDLWNASTGVTNANSMNSYLSSLSSDKYVIFSTFDEPRQNIDKIWGSLINYGANGDTLVKMTTEDQISYIMVGKKGIGENNAFFEKYGKKSSTGVDFSTKDLNHKFLTINNSFQTGVTLSDAIHYNCTNSCGFTNATTDFCGDGVVQSANGEQCDPKNYFVPSNQSSNASNQYGCSLLCKDMSGYCGDGVVDVAYGEECDPLNYFVPNAKQSGTNNTYNCGSAGTAKACKRLYFSDLDVPTNKYGGYCGDSKVQYDLTKASASQFDSTWKVAVTVDLTRPEQCDFNGYIIPLPSQSNSYYQYSCTDSSSTNACRAIGGYCGDSIIQSDYEECDHVSYVKPTPAQSSSSKMYSCGNTSKGTYACFMLDKNNGGGYCGDNVLQNSFGEICEMNSTSKFDVNDGGTVRGDLINLSCTAACGTSGDGWTCNTGYYWNKVSYGAGTQYTCRSIPLNSVKIGTLHGGDDYQCNAGFEKDGNGGCKDCDPGEYSTAGGSCSPCNAIDYSNWTTKGTNPNNCGFNCKGGYKYDGVARTCTSCTLGTWTPEANTSATCSNCTNKAANQKYTSTGTLVGNCSVATCSAGTYPANNVGYMDNCASCVAKPTNNSSWLKPGEDCTWSCNTNYYDTNSSSKNSSATGALNCDGICGNSIKTTGEACDNATGLTLNNQWCNNCALATCTNGPSNSTYTANGGGSNNCSWGCNASYYKNGNSCSSCPIGKYSLFGAASCSNCTNTLGAGLIYTSNSSIQTGCNISASTCPAGTSPNSVNGYMDSCSSCPTLGANQVWSNPGNDCTSQCATDYVGYPNCTLRNCTEADYTWANISVCDSSGKLRQNRISKTGNCVDLAYSSRVGSTACLYCAVNQTNSAFCNSNGTRSCDTANTVFTNTCTCNTGFTGSTCSSCATDYVNYPTCSLRACTASDYTWTDTTVCDSSGKLIQNKGAKLGTSNCDTALYTTTTRIGSTACSYCTTNQANSAFCNSNGTRSCDTTNKVFTSTCTCNTGFTGSTCSSCATDYVNYPTCSLRACTASDYTWTDTTVCDSSGKLIQNKGAKLGTSNCDTALYTTTTRIGSTACSYCTTNQANSAFCNSNGTRSCDTTNKVFTSTCTCNPDYYGATCGSQCSYGGWTNTVCKSDNTWSATRTVTGSNCAGVSSISNNGSCSYCTSSGTENQACTITNGTGNQTRTRTCDLATNNATYSGWGTCTATSCTAGYYGKNTSSCNLCAYSGWSNTTCKSDNTWSATRTITSGNATECTATLNSSNNGGCDYCTSASYISDSSACSNHGTRTNSYSCVNNNKNYAGWTACSCNTEWYGSTCASACTYNSSWTNYDCQSNNKWAAYKDNNVGQPTQCPRKYNYDNGACTYCASPGVDNASCKYVSSTYSYGCSGCCDDWGGNCTCSCSTGYNYSYYTCDNAHYCR